jgi:hypothetical protein
MSCTLVPFAKSTLDHLCRVRSCVNPAHLEPVPHRENVLRGVSSSALAARRNTCANGHPYTADNTRISKDGARQCRQCQKDWQARNRTRVTEMQRERRKQRRVETIEQAQVQREPALMEASS